ncbi:MAG TPA: glycosyltransferase family 4 protein [Blastocatellia bacterium]|nr:glycosyltransferase family 4 protein [Blastocatellia bacterium]
MPGAHFTALNKSGLKQQSKLAALKAARALKPAIFAIFVPSVHLQSSREAMRLFAALTGARRIAVGDHANHTVIRSRLAVFIVCPLKLLFELVAGYLILVPICCAISLILQHLGPIVREARRHNSIHHPVANRHSGSPTDTGSHAALLYVRAAPVITGEASPSGGMATHVQGFTAAATALGHEIRFISCGSLDVASAGEAEVVIPPSGRMTATRALFELYNSLVFTISALRLARPRASQRFDIIYQRYNRFNATGVVLSLATGLPLFLEYNGSEVWVARNWDPVGLLWLLKRFETVNQGMADLIIVVSEADRANLLQAGIASARILVNPNGVDTDRFHPGCGGDRVRARLNLEAKLVIGFLGTFGPWHGTQVLATAVTKLRAHTDFHFLFIGDGDLRAPSHAIIDAGGARHLATFTGRIPNAEVPSYLDACDILVAPHVPPTDGSQFFGSPTKFFEYLATARPVIASRLGQMAQIIEDGQTGVLVEPGNADALAQAIEQLALNPEARARIGAAARALVAARFTWSHSAVRVFQAFQSTTTPPGHPERSTQFTSRVPNEDGGTRH